MTGVHEQVGEIRVEPVRLFYIRVKLTIPVTMLLSQNYILFNPRSLAFVLSMDNSLIESFTAGGGVTTLPMEIFSRIRTSVSPDINALSVVLMIASGGFALIAEMIRYQSEKKRLQ